VDRVRQVVVGYAEDETGLPPGQLLTGDHNLVNVRVVLYWKVDPDLVDRFVVEGAQVPATLERVLEATAAQWVAGRGVDEVLLLGKTGLRGEVIEHVRERIAGQGLGVEVLDARVEQIAPPDEVKDAFDNVSRAQTQIATLRNRAEQEEATRRRQAGGPTAQPEVPRADLAGGARPGVQQAQGGRAGGPAGPPPGAGGAGPVHRAGAAGQALMTRPGVRR
jgi:membrane protease subunit HflK